MLEKNCAVCKKPSTETCSTCKETYYCSKEHENEAWKTHKYQCVPYMIETNSKLGRYVIAKRDIEEGEVIMKHEPLVCGPKTASFAICLGCHKNLENNFYTCSKCSWPLCRESCEGSFYHKDECKVYAENNYNPCVLRNSNKQIAYAVVLPIRVLLLKTLDQAKFELITNLQSNLDLNINTTLYKFLRMQIVPMVKKVITNSDETEILNICSIFDTNCFEIRDQEGLIKIRGLYPRLSFISHGCKVNTKHAFTDSTHEAIVTATVPIKKGELIRTTYTQTLWCSLSRRAHLKQTKNFLCDCERCSDPTELGLYSGSIYCEACNDGKSKLISTNPLEENADWSCENCAYSLPSEYVQDVNSQLRREMGSIGSGNPEGFLAFLMEYENILHPTNCHVVEVKYALVQIFGNIQGFKLYELSDENLDRKIQFCSELIKIADILEPGSSKFRVDLINEETLAVEEKNKRTMCKVSLDVD